MLAPLLAHSPNAIDLRPVDPQDMLAELRDDNKDLVSRMRVAHDLCSELRDSATTSILEVYIDETERRVWFLYEASRNATGH